MKQSLWQNNSPLQELCEQLQRLIPSEGSVKGPRTQKLESLRKAINCYYDLYNNGLCNRARSFSKVFGIQVGCYKQSSSMYYRLPTSVEMRVEAKMQQKILDAAVEQKFFSLI